jgi:uncharacterized membrane protein
MVSAEQSAISLARLALIAGVMVSFVFLIAGLGFEIAGNASGVDASLLFEAGIMILLCTPVVRVIILAVGFLRERETTFALVGFCILLLLGASVAIGLHGE